jgi:hypothetical protein
MGYKILLLYADNLFTDKNISDDKLIEYFKLRYSDIDNQITSLRSSQIKNVEELNEEIRKHTIIQIISHGFRGGVSLSLFGQDRWTYEDLFNNSGIKFKEAIVLLNVCYGGNLHTLNQRGIPEYPSFLLAYSNTLDHYKGAITLFLYIHQKLKNIFLETKTTNNPYKVNAEVYSIVTQGFEGVLLEIINKEIEIFGHTRITSSNDPGIVLLHRPPIKT